MSDKVACVCAMAFTLLAFSLPAWVPMHTAISCTPSPLSQSQRAAIQEWLEVTR